MPAVHRRRVATLTVVAAGVLVGHWLTYLLEVPDAHARTAALAATGHGYLSVAAELVTVLAAIAVASVFVGALVHAGSRPRPGRALAARLSALQVAAFCAMEVVERVVAGSSLGDLVRGGLLPTGIAVNVGVALLGAVALRWILRTADRVAGSIGTGRVAPAVRPAALLVPLPDIRRRPSLLAFAAVPARGPPSPVCS